MKKLAILVPLLLLTACGTTPEVPSVNVNTVVPALSETMKNIDLSKPSTTPEEDTARLQRAVLEQKSDICDTIGDQKKKETCTVAVIHSEASVKGDMSLCTKLHDDIQEKLCRRGVIYPKSVKEQNKGLCAELKDEQAVKDCEQNYIFVTAVQKKDAGMCAELKEVSMKTQCEDQVKGLGITSSVVNGNMNGVVPMSSNVNSTNENVAVKK